MNGTNSIEFSQDAARGGKLGLALSGGGFRAALFHVGVLAQLAEQDLLRFVSVISTVSGGSIIGAFYYLRVIKLMYMDDPEVDDAIQPPMDMAAVLSANGIIQLALGIFPGPLIALCAAAF